MPFGPQFTQALFDVSTALKPLMPTLNAPRCVLTVLAYESRLDPACVNSLGYSGLYQRAKQKDASGNSVLYISLPGKLNPAVQMRDAGRFWLDMVKQMGIQEFRTLGQFYCCNLGPARVTSPNGIVYADPLRPFGGVPEAEEYYWVARKWPGAYAAQDAKLDAVKKGYISMTDLEPQLLAAGRVLAKRIDEEMQALADLAWPAA